MCLRAGLGDVAEGDRADDGVLTVCGQTVLPELIDTMVGDARQETQRSDALLVLAG